jgi:hypothetical protein
MGLDFIRTAAPNFNRVLDRRLVELHTPKLFSRDLPIVSRTARAELCEGVTVKVGDKVLLRIIDGKIVLQRLNTAIARCPNAPAEFIAHLHAGAGIAEGEIVSVQSISQTLEVSICD